MYVLRCFNNGSYSGLLVSMPGSRCSYTSILNNAQVFQSRAGAERGACGNEYVVSTESVMEGLES